MNATTAAIDLAKNVFQVVLVDANYRVLEQHRLTRAQFERFFDNRKVSRIVMEACGSAHHWARVFGARGIEAILLPAMYVRAYVRRSKTDAADALALLEALRCADIVAVKVKSVEQQSLQALHRTRSLWMGTRTSRINALRGFCRELGLHVPIGARTGLEAMGRAVADEQSPITPLLRPIMLQLLDEIRLLETRVAQLERQLAQLARESHACKLLMSIPGIGLLTATAILAATAGSVAHFKSARHFASWFGLTQGELFRHYASYGTHLQDGRSLPAHAPYPRRALSAAGSQSRAAERHRAHWPASLGPRAAGSLQSQQERLRAR
jgi:transposase